MSDAALEIAGLRAALAASEARAKTAERELAQDRAVVGASEAMIAHLRLEIARLRREQYGHSSERRARLIDQMELQLEDLEAAATEDEIAAGKATKTTPVAGFERRQPARKPFPEHLSRERVVIEAPTACSCCGSDRIVKMGEDITETLEVVPRQWKDLQTVREKFTCRACERVSQPPAPFHATPRGWAGPNLLATILFESETLSAICPRTMVERAASASEPAGRALCAGRRRPQPVDAGRSGRRLRGRARSPSRADPQACPGGGAAARGRYDGPAAGEGRNAHRPALPQVRDDRPFEGGAPPAALFHFSRDREMAHPNRYLAGWQGILQADAYGGCNGLYRDDRDPGPVGSALTQLSIVERPTPGSDATWRRASPLVSAIRTASGLELVAVSACHVRSPRWRISLSK